MVKFMPLGERLIVKPIEEEQTTSSGIFLPDTAKEKPQEGEVVAVGPGRVTDEGNRVPMELTTGTGLSTRSTQGLNTRTPVRNT